MTDVTGMQSAGRVLPLFKGDYDNDTAYEQTDVVLYNNSSYIAIQDTIGNTPPELEENRNEYWQLIAKGIVDVSDSTVEFIQATTRTNIASGETNATLFGKIMKWFSDLKPHAFNALTNNLLATVSGVSGLDAVQGNVLDGKIETTNENLKKVFYFNTTNELLEAFEINKSKTYTSIMGFLEDLPINIDVTCLVNTDNVSSNLSGLFPSNYGLLNIKKGYNNNYSSLEYYIGGGIKYLHNKNENKWSRIATSHDIDAINGDLVNRAIVRSGYILAGQSAVFEFTSFHCYLFLLRDGLLYIQAYSTTLEAYWIVASNNVGLSFYSRKMTVSVTIGSNLYFSIIDLGNSGSNASGTTVQL